MLQSLAARESASPPQVWLQQLAASLAVHAGDFAASELEAALLALLQLGHVPSAPFLDDLMAQLPPALWRSSPREALAVQSALCQMMLREPKSHETTAAEAPLAALFANWVQRTLELFPKGDDGAALATAALALSRRLRLPLSHPAVKVLAAKGLAAAADCR